MCCCLIDFAMSSRIVSNFPRKRNELLRCFKDVWKIIFIFLMGDGVRGGGGSVKLIQSYCIIVVGRADDSSTLCRV